MKSLHLFVTLRRVWVLEMIQFLCQLSCWIGNSKWIRRPCNSNIWIISQYLKSKVPMTHHGRIGASICVIHLVHAPPFASYKVLLLITYFDLCLTPHDSENVRPWVTSHTCFQCCTYTSVKCKIDKIHGLTYVGTSTRFFMSQCATWWTCHVVHKGHAMPTLGFYFEQACNRCLVSIMALISGVHNMSQNEIGAPT